MEISGDLRVVHKVKIYDDGMTLANTTRPDNAVWWEPITPEQVEMWLHERNAQWDHRFKGRGVLLGGFNDTPTVEKLIASWPLLATRCGGEIES